MTKRAMIPVFLQPPLTLWQRCRRIFRIFLVAFVLLAIGVGLGTLGYHYLVGLPWIDAFLNAAMVLAGEGPVVDVAGPAAKIFVSLYSIGSGLIFVGVAVILVTPILKWTLHRFHLDDVIQEVFEPEQPPPDSPPAPQTPPHTSKNRPITRPKK